MKKKLIITESQFEKVRFLKENTDIIAKFEALCNKNIAELNKLYSKVTNISISEIIEGRVNIDGITQYLNNLEDNLNKANNTAYSVINNLPDADLDLKIDAAHSRVSDKISSLNLILLSLEQIQKYEKEHKLSKSFGDVQPIDITGTQ